MSFLRPSLSVDSGPELLGRSVVLRRPVLADYAAWSDLRGASRDHLVPFEPQWAMDELSQPAFKRRLRQHASDAKDDLGYAFFVFARDGGALLGGITLSNVRRGVAQSANVGYWLGKPYAGQGLMTDAVQTIAPHAFSGLHLHRLEAASLLHNTPSIRVLEKAGFTREGLARRYLRINGQWQDHVTFARLQDDRSAATAGSQ